MRLYRLVVGTIPLGAALLAARLPVAEAQQPPVIVTSSPADARARIDGTGRSRWVPQVIATARPVGEAAREVVPVSGGPPPSLPPVAATKVAPREFPGAARPADAGRLPALTGSRPAVEMTAPSVGAAPAPLGANLLVEKVAPLAVSLGKPLAYEILIRNRGTASLHGVRVEEALPAGARFVSGEPRPEQRGSVLVWDLGTLTGGAESKLKVQVEPTTPGEFASVATVSSSTTCIMRTQVAGGSAALPTPAPAPAPPPSPPTPAPAAAKPGSVGLTVAVPPTARLGETVTLRIELTNNSLPAGRPVVVKVQLPAGLQHAAGASIEAEVECPAVGQKLPLPLPVKVVGAGRQTVETSVAVEGGEEIKSQATVEIAAAMGSGVTPVSLPGRVGDLQPLPPPHARGAAPTPPPPEPPARRELFARDAAPGAALPAALTVDVVSRDETVEVGAEATFEVSVGNQGALAATNVQLSAVLPEGLVLLGADGPTGRQVNGGQVVFEPLSALEPRGRAVYRLRVRGQRPGEGRLRVFVACAQYPRPEFKEAVVRVVAAREAGKLAGRPEGNKREQ